jgi:hypothetical protein
MARPGSHCRNERRPTQFEIAHYGKLLGRKVLGVDWEDFERPPLPASVLNDKDCDGSAARVAVLANPEGNGPGT